MSLVSDVSEEPSEFVFKGQESQLDMGLEMKRLWSFETSVTAVSGARNHTSGGPGCSTCVPISRPRFVFYIILYSVQW